MLGRFSMRIPSTRLTAIMCRLTTAAAGGRSSDASLRSLLFDSPAAELGRYAATTLIREATSGPCPMRYLR